MKTDRADELRKNEKSVFISYSSQEGDSHIKWVKRFALDLIDYGYDVVVDMLENPKPKAPGKHSTFKEKLQYKIGELNAKYIKELQQPVGHLGNGFILRPSPIPLSTDLSPEWERYMNVKWFFEYLDACNNILIINTPTYIHQTSYKNRPDKAGYVLEEFQAILSSIIKNRNKTIISVLRSGDNFHSEYKKRYFTMVDFREDAQYVYSMRTLHETIKKKHSNKDINRPLEAIGIIVSKKDCSPKDFAEYLTPNLTKIMSQMELKDKFIVNLEELSQHGKVSILHLDDSIFRELKEGGPNEVAKYVAYHVAKIDIGNVVVNVHAKVMLQEIFKKRGSIEFIVCALGMS